MVAANTIDHTEGPSTQETPKSWNMAIGRIMPVFLLSLFGIGGQLRSILLASIMNHNMDNI